MNRYRKMLSAVTLLCMAGFGGMGSALAGPPCPQAAIKLVIANPPGGVGDHIGRQLGEKAATILGQPVVVENRAGATTAIGTAYVAQSKPDGCTLLVLTASGVVVSVLREKLPYNLETDFTPVVGLGSFPMALAVPVASKLHSIDDVAAATKSQQGLTYASGGNGTLAHLSAVRLVKHLGGSALHVPFRGNPDALQALLGNQVQMFFLSTSEAIPLATAEKIRILGVTSDSRLPTLANVPTMKEQGFADFNPRLWYAVMAPAGTPPATMSALRDAFAQALKDPSIQERFNAVGFATDVKNAAEVSAHIKTEAARWGKVIKENSIKSAD